MKNDSLNIVHIFVFSYKPYVNPGIRTPFWHTLFKYVFNLKDVAEDVS
jgi:hypothetical protein